MIYNGKKESKAGLKKPQGQNRDVGNIKMWGLLKVGVQFGGGGSRWGIGMMRFQSMGKIGKKNLSKLKPTSSLKIFTEGAVTMEAGSLFLYFTTLTEKADPLLRWWLVPWSTW